MKYKIIWNGHKYYEETIKAENWIEFLDILNIITGHFSQCPDLIYLTSEREND